MQATTRPAITVGHACADSIAGGRPGLIMAARGQAGVQGWPLGSVRQRAAACGSRAVDTVREQLLIDPLGLPGLFDLVAPAKGLVVFAHGSGSGPLSRRNQVGANWC